MKSHMVKQGKYVFMENITNKKNHLGVVCGIFSNQCLAGAGGLGGPACHQDLTSWICVKLQNHPLTWNLL